MLELIVIALGSTVVAFFLVWLWRKLTEFKGATMASLSANRNTQLKLTSQQGYVSLPNSMANSAMANKAAGRAVLRKSHGSRKPWGW